MMKNETSKLQTGKELPAAKTVLKVMLLCGILSSLFYVGLHGPMTAVMSLFILLSMGFGAFLLGKRFRFYSFATIVMVILFGVLTGLQASKLEAGQSTPWMGLTERINIYVTMLWFSLLSIKLLHVRGELSRDGKGGLL